MRKAILASMLSLSLFLCVGIIFVHAQGSGTNGGLGGGTNSGLGSGDNTGLGEGTNGTSKLSIHLNNPLKTGDNLYELLKAIVNEILLPIGGIIAVLAFIWTGFKFVKAQGNSSELEEARRSLFYVAIGTAVLLGSWVLVNVMINTINQLRS